MDLEFFLAGWGAGFLGYAILQVIAIATVHGRRRILMSLPAFPMLIVLAWTQFAYSSESNLWPIVMILSSPIAILIVIVLWTILFARQRREARLRM